MAEAGAFGVSGPGGAVLRHPTRVVCRTWSRRSCSLAGGPGSSKLRQGVRHTIALCRISSDNKFSNS
eukprot:6180013-Pleurochrysis_carterae.AAC.2